MSVPHTAFNALQWLPIAFRIKSKILKIWSLFNPPVLFSFGLCLVLYIPNIMDAEFIRSATISPVFINAVLLPRMCSLLLSLNTPCLWEAFPDSPHQPTLLATLCWHALLARPLHGVDFLNAISSFFHKFHEDMINDYLIHHSILGCLGHSRALNAYWMDGWMNEWLNEYIDSYPWPQV